VNGLYALSGGIISGLTSMAQSTERIIDGNGGPDGPYAQANEVMAATGTDYDASGQPLNPVLDAAPAPAQAPPAAPDVPGNEMTMNPSGPR